MSIEANPVITKLVKASGALRAMSIRGAMEGEIDHMKPGFAARTKTPLSVYVRDPLLTMNMNRQKLGLLVRECLHRISILERKIADGQAQAQPPSADTSTGNCL
jgi:hypothetical protein